MSKISIDLTDGLGRLVGIQQKLNILSGCHSGLSYLGNIAEAITTIRVTFVSFEDEEDKVVGPRFTFYFSDPLKNECSHGFDYRFIGEGRCEPSGEEISDYIVVKLKPFIVEYLKKCEEKISNAQRLLSQQLL